MSKKPSYDYDFIVIGTGAGGSVAATLAARAGKRVAVIEADTFGGDSPNYSDIPTAALLRAAHLYDEARHGSRFGLRSNTLGYNYHSLQAWKELAIKRTGAGGNRRYYENQGIGAYQGEAHFLSPHEITVNRRHLSAAYFLIATGSHWVAPSIPGLDKVSFLTPRSTLNITRPPKSIFIIGGGQAGVELAQLLATFGTKVYLAEIASRLLPHFDEEAGSQLAKTLHDQKGVTVLTQSRVLSVVKDGLGKRISFSRGNVEHSVRTEALLVATGRLPTVDLGLTNAGVEYTPKGIEVDDYLQTSAKHIYAAGDVLGRTSNTHTALLESRLVAHNLLDRNKLIPDYTATPSLIFTDPEIAQVGLSEDDCLRRDLKIKKSIAPLSLIARSNTSDVRDGFVKLVTDQSGMLLGATIMAPRAGEMIHELALAIKNHLTATDIARTPHAFLSWSEAIQIAAAKLS